MQKCAKYIVLLLRENLLTPTSKPFVSKLLSKPARLLELGIHVTCHLFYNPGVYEAFGKPFKSLVDRDCNQT